MPVSFPDEVVLIIFKHVASLADLAQCRLVCKQWDSVAEAAMFSKEIVLKSNNQAIKLYGHLFGRSHHARKITHLHFDSSYTNKSNTVMYGLLDVALTSSMISLSGIVNEDTFYKTLVDTANEPGRTFPHLTTIPLQDKPFTEPLSTALLQFKNTLKSVTINNHNAYPDDHLWTFVDRLHEFTSLQELSLASKFQRIPDVERVLKECEHLQTLKLQTAFDSSIGRQDQLQPWMGSNVKQISGLRKLIIMNECVGEFVEYLVYKYPNVEEIIIDANKCCLNLRDMVMFAGNMNDVLESIASIPKKSLSLVLCHSVNFVSIVRYFDEKGYTVVIEKVISDDELLVKIEGL